MSFNGKFPIMQTHLDFHTSPDIEGIGSKFSKENFQAALKAGNLDSITVFAKCHHSMCYYPTEVGIKHPHLDFDFTGAMIEAAHEIGVKAPVYITAGFSHADAVNHPEWVVVSNKEDIGKPVDKTFNPDESKNYSEWDLLCLNGNNGYAKHIYELTEEICKRYKDLDGLFFDICGNEVICYCEACLKGMKEMGIDPDNEEDTKRFLIENRRKFFANCVAILKKYHPDATVFFNGCAGKYRPEYHEFQTHFELENLPTAWGGYNDLPMQAKYFGKKGVGLIGMTGKFHLAWGEFGGFKAKEALKYEIAIMAMYGAGGSIGDHMHPDGEMEMQTYENIGYAYKYLEKIAPYCYDGKIVSNIGVYTSNIIAANEGISNIFLENQVDYDLVTNNNFKDFDTVIIAEKAVLDDEALKALKDYVENGGKLIVMADALVKDGKFQLDFGVKYLGEDEYDWDYIVSLDKHENLPDAPMLCYVRGHRVEAGEGVEVIAEYMTPYFNRTKAHFCGHKNTPHDKNCKRHPAIMKKGNVVYVSHSLPNEYFTYGSLFHKRYFMMALNLVYSGALLKVEGMGSQGRCTMIDQPEKSRYCINMAYATPVRRGKAEIIEDIMTVYNIKFEFKTDKAIKKVYLPLAGKELEFTNADGKVKFTVDQLNCHETVVLEYGE